jgi:hypothetical protein
MNQHRLQSQNPGFNSNSAIYYGVTLGKDLIKLSEFFCKMLATLVPYSHNCGEEQSELTFENPLQSVWNMLALVECLLFL